MYEVSTETLFLGRQDAMQRQSLVPLREFMAGRSANSGAGTSLLEVAGGTGRFATFLKVSAFRCPHVSLADFCRAYFAFDSASLYMGFCSAAALAHVCTLHLAQVALL